MAEETRILLFGHDGQIGWELRSRLAGIGTVHGLSYPDVDFSDPPAVRRLVRDVSPGLIVNAAAYTAVDRAEDEPLVARAVNAGGPAVLGEEARRLGAFLVHYSTDFVFDGVKGTPYREDDLPRPLSVYGQTKWEGDQAVLASGCACLIFRVSWIYGLRGSNFLLTLRRIAAQGKPLRVVDDQIGCPTWCGVVADATLDVLKQAFRPGCRGDAFDEGGLYNMVCGGHTSWYGFARAFLSRAAVVEPIPASEYPTAATRPAYSVLDCGRLERTFGVSMPDWQDALGECMRGETGKTA
jgi:dTDP-4-dehydrorhamnose reductase